MIVSFGDSATEDLYHNRPTSRAQRLPREMAAVAITKMDVLKAAAAIIDLRSPPGNNLGALKGDRRVFRSIRANNQRPREFRVVGKTAHAASL